MASLAARSLTSRLGIELPIIQAPMAGVSSAEMAAAVSNAGGLGSVAIGALDVEAAAREIANELTRLGEAIPATSIPPFPMAYDATRALDALARTSRNTHFGAHWAGCGAARTRAMPAGALVAMLARELADATRS